ncbi:hypothetical protein J1N35_042602 [Gossypium stocksii]|uniref:RNase H type-1 domain-containing protein n=1 Tax=Gossypium stocksii TaxID=47602 RepID=A0A9D3ZEL9_9ROSI|nr:hypothetical protein J1N35_042602 [Gossypium stocksii]
MLMMLPPEARLRLQAFQIRDRDHCAKWTSGFTMQIGDESVLKIEVKTILEGLKIKWDSELRQLEVDCDNYLVVECAANRRALSIMKSLKKQQYSLSMVSDPADTFQCWEC